MIRSGSNTLDRSKNNLGETLADSISLPLEPSRKLDLRSNIPLNRCKAFSVSALNGALPLAGDSAVREEQMAWERQQIKTQKVEDFLKKTQERVKVRLTRDKEEVQKNIDEIALRFNKVKAHCINAKIGVVVEDGYNSRYGTAENEEYRKGVDGDLEGCGNGGRPQENYGKKFLEEKEKEKEKEKTGKLSGKEIYGKNLSDKLKTIEIKEKQQKYSEKGGSNEKINTEKTEKGRDVVENSYKYSSYITGARGGYISAKSLEISSEGLEEIKEEIEIFNEKKKVKQPKKNKDSEKVEECESREKLEEDLQMSPKKKKVKKNKDKGSEEEAHEGKHKKEKKNKKDKNKHTGGYVDELESIEENTKSNKGDEKDKKKNKEKKKKNKSKDKSEKALKENHSWNSEEYNEDDNYDANEFSKSTKEKTDKKDKKEKKDKKAKKDKKDKKHKSVKEESPENPPKSFASPHENSPPFFESNQCLISEKAFSKLPESHIDLSSPHFSLIPDHKTSNLLSSNIFPAMVNSVLSSMQTALLASTTSIKHSLPDHEIEQAQAKVTAKFKVTKEKISKQWNTKEFNENALRTELVRKIADINEHHSAKQLARSRSEGRNIEIAKEEEIEKAKPRQKSEKKLRFVCVENMKKKFGPKASSPLSGRPAKKSRNSSKSPGNTVEVKQEEVKSTELNYSTRHLEQLRFSAALKTMVRDKMKEKFTDDIPAVCTCGAMNRRKNLKNPVQCANNCPFYKRQQEFQRALSEMLQSFKASQ